jgi:glutamate racemase
MDSRPIGLFDSGVGGLSVLCELRRLAPAERYIYFADTLWFPYGARPPAEIRKRSFAIVRRLLDADVKLLVVACNTASAAALDDLRQAFPVPFVGMVPGLKPAVERSRSRRVGILATPGTLGGELYYRVANDFGAGATIREIPAHGLAEFVENGDLSSEALKERLRGFLSGPVAAGVDTVVLGCSHYNFVAPLLRDMFPGIELVDTSEAVARRSLQVLSEADALAPARQPGGLSVIVSGDRSNFEQRMQSLAILPATEVPA